MDPGAGQSGITLRGLKKTYGSPRGPLEAVRDVSVEVDVGETVALLGPNGAGKSTTVELLLGLQEPDEGSVEVFGGPPQLAVSAGRLGAMLQGGGVLRDLTVRELLAMMAALCDARGRRGAAVVLARASEPRRARGSGLGSTGWAVVAAWTIACAVLARRAYERDTKRM